MKELSFVPGRLLKLLSVITLQNFKVYLFGILIGSSALHLLLIWKATGNIDQLIISAIFWGAILYLVWQKQDKLKLESRIFASFFGLLLLILVCFKSISLFWFEASFLRVIPLMVALSLALLSSGVRGLKQYWRELIIVLLLCLPTSLFITAIDQVLKVSILTTKFAVVILWYLGFAVSRQDNIIILHNITAIVTPDCTGISTGLLLLKLSTVYTLIFSTTWHKIILLFGGAISISFLISGLRVALIATMVSNQTAFSYWHGAEGNQIFSTISIFLFGFLCHHFLVDRPAPKVSR